MICVMMAAVDARRIPISKVFFYLADCNWIAFGCNREAIRSQTGGTEMAFDFTSTGEPREGR